MLWGAVTKGGGGWRPLFCLEGAARSRGVPGRVVTKTDRHSSGSKEVTVQQGGEAAGGRGPTLASSLSCSPAGLAVEAASQGRPSPATPPAGVCVTHQNVTSGPALGATTVVTCVTELAWVVSIPGGDGSKSPSTETKSSHSVGGCWSTVSRVGSVSRFGHTDPS